MDNDLLSIWLLLPWRLVIDDVAVGDLGGLAVKHLNYIHDSTPLGADDGIAVGADHGGYC